MGATQSQEIQIFADEPGNPAFFRHVLRTAFCRFPALSLGFIHVGLPLFLLA